jgi:lipoprotein-anchoring transpeptidase ErfK/SrfK
MRIRAGVGLIAIVTMASGLGGVAMPGVGAAPTAPPTPVEALAPELPAPPETPAPAPTDTVVSSVGDEAATAGTVSLAEVAEPATATQTGMPVRGGATQVGPPLGRNLDTIPPANSGNGRRVIYSISGQRLWAVDENDEVVKTHRVSGRTDQPYPGTYAVFSKSRYTFASSNPNVRWGYMVRFAYGRNGGNIGFHEIPTKCTASGCAPVQNESQLGTPLSGGCVRQATVDAIWMYEWADIGTVVVVLP